MLTLWIWRFNYRASAIEPAAPVAARFGLSLPRPAPGPRETFQRHPPREGTRPTSGCSPRTLTPRRDLCRSRYSLADLRKAAPRRSRVVPRAWSESSLLMPERRDAWRAAAAKTKSARRLGQSGRLNAQQTLR